MHLNAIISVMLSILITTITCREAGKGDDPCVTFISPCDICASFTEEQPTKITHRKRYVKKPDKKADKNDQELDLLGDNSVESFAGPQADLESAADHLFISLLLPYSRN